jgi:hypothetical protein
MRANAATKQSLHCSSQREAHRHELEKLDGFLPLADLLAGIDQGREDIAVGLNPRRLHLLKQLQRLLKAPAPLASRYYRRVGSAASKLIRHGHRCGTKVLAHGMQTVAPWHVTCRPLLLFSRRATHADHRCTLMMLFTKGHRGPPRSSHDIWRYPGLPLHDAQRRHRLIHKEKYAQKTYDISNMHTPAQAA